MNFRNFILSTFLLMLLVGCTSPVSPAMNKNTIETTEDWIKFVSSSANIEEIDSVLVSMEIEQIIKIKEDLVNDVSNLKEYDERAKEKCRALMYITILPIGHQTAQMIKKQSYSGFAMSESEYDMFLHRVDDKLASKKVIDVLGKQEANDILYTWEQWQVNSLGLKSKRQADAEEKEQKIIIAEDFYVFASKITEPSRWFEIDDVIQCMSTDKYINLIDNYADYLVHSTVDVKSKAKVYAFLLSGLYWYIPENKDYFISLQTDKLNDYSNFGLAKGVIEECLGEDWIEGIPHEYNKAIIENAKLYKGVELPLEKALEYVSGNNPAK